MMQNAVLLRTSQQLRQRVCLELVVRANERNDTRGLGEKDLGMVEEVELEIFAKGISTDDLDTTDAFLQCSPAKHRCLA